MNEDEYVTGTGQRIGSMHRRDECSGIWCVIHNPAPGPWSDWPTHWVENPAPLPVFNGVMTRMCPHQILHPCVEDMIMFNDRGGDHGCDGCPCGPEHIGSRAMTAAGPTPLLAPPDYDGQPARLSTELTLKEQFEADQNQAGAEETLSTFVSYLVGMVIENNGNHPGRASVPGPWLVHMDLLHPTQVKALAQFACWSLAEWTLMRMQESGDLTRRFNLKLAKGFEHDHE